MSIACCLLPKKCIFALRNESEMKKLITLCAVVIVAISMTACKSGNRKMQWSFTYRDGHSDTWEVYRNL